MEITNEQLLQLLQEKLEQRPAKSMLKMEISDFTADAYKQGEFIKVSKKDLLGKWSVLFFYPADFTFVCPTELADLQDNYEKFKKIGCEIYSVSMDSHSYTRHGMMCLRQFRRSSIRCWRTRPDCSQET